MKVAMILAVRPDGLIAVDGHLPWHSPEDMARFKALTTGGVVVMGRKTWESLGCKPLPNRGNIVLSRQGRVITSPHTSFTPVTCLSVTDALCTAIGLAKASETVSERALWVIGGVEIYEEFLPYVKEAHISLIDDYTPPKAGAKRTYIASELLNTVALWERAEMACCADHTYFKFTKPA